MGKQNMKILFILEYYYPNIGGVEKLFKDLAEGLTSNGHQVEVITTQFRKELPLRENINGVEIRRLKLRNRFTFTFFSIFSILPHIKKFDVIHTTSYNAAFPAWMAAKIYRKKSIITFHEVWGDLWKELPYLSQVHKALFSLYESFILKLKFDTYIAVSDFTKKKLEERGVPQYRIKRIYNGICKDDYQVDIKEMPTRFTFTYFGRLGVSKGLNLIIPAAAAFIDKHPDAIFKCIIPNVPKAFYSRIIEQLRPKNLGENLQMMHHLSFDELKKEISHSHVVLIPSYSEGFCFAAVETTALSTAIISSGNGALQETVSGKHITMEAFNKEALIKAMERAYHSDFDYSKPKDFDLEDSIHEYLKLYNELQ